MRRRMLPLLMAVAAPATAQETPVLTVLTYDSFVSEWCPGPLVEKAFQAECGCDRQFVTGG